MVRFHGTLSEETVHFRYFGAAKLEKRIAHERLTRICFNDYDREIALVAVRQNPDTKEDEIIGTGRLIKAYNGSQAQFAILISDAFQGHGLGTYLLSRLVEIGRQEGVDRIIGHILPENHAMRSVSQRVGFNVSFDRVNEVMLAEKDLDGETQEVLTAVR